MLTLLTFFIFFNSAAQLTFTFSIFLSQVKALMSRISTELSERHSESYSLQTPRPIGGASAHGGLKLNCQLIIRSHQAGSTVADGQPAPPRFTLFAGSFGFCIHDGASSFCSQHALGILSIQQPWLNRK